MRIFLVEEYMDNIDQNKWKTAACIDNILPAIAPDVLKNIQVTFRCTSTSCLQRLAQDPDTASLFTSLQQSLLKVSPKSVEFTLTTYTRRRAPCAISSLSFFEAIIKERFPLLWNLNLINSIVQDPECESYIPGFVICIHSQGDLHSLSNRTRVISRRASRVTRWVVDSQYRPLLRHSMGRGDRLLVEALVASTHRWHSIHAGQQASRHMHPHETGSTRDHAPLQHGC